MIVDISEKQESFSVHLEGTEQWLKNIYDSFQQNDNSAVIQGTLRINLDNPTYVLVDGEVRFNPLLDCSRCAGPVSWPISEKIHILLIRELPEFEQEKDLTNSELSEYFLEQGSKLDLEVIVNDTIQMARPERSADRCEKCQKVTQVTNLAATTQRHGCANHPFAALGQLKSK